jgi:hypothetical protein
MGRSLSKLCFLLSAAAIHPTGSAAEKTNAPSIPPKFYSLKQVEEAKARAAAEQKPIGWISTHPEYLAPHKNPMGSSSHASTAYAVRALQNVTVLVVSNPRTDNHSEPPIVDQALHTPDPHYTIPGVVILTPALDKVIYNLPHTTNSQQRIKMYTEALQKIRDKSSWQPEKKSN